MAKDQSRRFSLVRQNPFAVVCGLLCVALVGLSYYRSGALAEANTELDAKTAEDERLTTNIKHGAKLDEDLSSVSGSMDRINARLIRSSELASNLQYFYRLETEAGVKLLELRQASAVAKPKDAKPGFVGVPFTVAVQGDYAHVLDFLRRVEKGRHFSRILAASVASAVSGSGEQVGGGALLTLSLQIEILGTS